MIKYRLFFLLFFTLLLTLKTFAQFEGVEETEKKQKKQTALSDRVFFGGDFGLQFGSITLIKIAPQVGYFIVPQKFNIGGSATYIYNNNRYYQYATSIYGGSVFTQFIPVEFLLLHAEVEALNLDNLDNYPVSVTRIWNTSVLVGGGYRMKVGQRGAINYMILWDLNESRYSPYTNPIIRLSFNF